MTLGDGIGRNKGCKSYVFQKGYKTATLMMKQMIIFTIGNLIN